ncbi:hypothetical protein M5689_020954 [Euphorbia peplus]|nr:hypothetical protein M5689_020954 [Euphorbia peplus]
MLIGVEERTGPMWYRRLTSSDEPSNFLEEERVLGGSLGFIRVFGVRVWVILGLGLAWVEKRKSERRKKEKCGREIMVVDVVEEEEEGEYLKRVK